MTARFTTKQEIAEARADLVSQIAFLDSINTGCAFCEHGSPSGTACKLANWQEPPKDVQAVGCSSWVFNGIPF